MVGGSGYTGAELLRLLAGHPDIEVGLVTADSNAGARVRDLYPSLAAAYPDLVYDAHDTAVGSDLAGLDVVFLALPHGESQKVAGALVDTVGHLVDLGADFRLPIESYDQWYGAGHAAPELLDRFAFGLPELYRDEIAGVPARGRTRLLSHHGRGSRRSSPRAWWSRRESWSTQRRGCRARAGTEATSLFAEVDENVVAYGLLTHRHTGEMELALEHAAGTPVQVLFTPHLVPMTRGILATCYARRVRERELHLAGVTMRQQSVRHDVLVDLGEQARGLEPPPRARHAGRCVDHDAGALDEAVGEQRRQCERRGRRIAPGRSDVARGDDVVAVELGQAEGEPVEQLRCRVALRRTTRGIASTGRRKSAPRSTR